MCFSWEFSKSLIEWGLKRGFIFYGQEVWDEYEFPYEEWVKIKMTEPNKLPCIYRPLKTESFFFGWNQKTKKYKK